MMTLTLDRPLADVETTGETILSHIIRALKGRTRRQVGIRQLARLDDRMLRDVGLARR